MDEITTWLHKLWSHDAAKVWGIILGLLWYLVEPTAAFVALWIAVASDLFTRLLAEAVKAGGFLVAIQTGRIRSRKAFTRTAVKIVGYFILAVVAHQSKSVVQIEQISILFSAIIYSFLFLVESISIVENLVDAGLDSLNPLLLRFRRERERLENPDQAGGQSVGLTAQQPQNNDPERWIEP